MDRETLRNAVLAICGVIAVTLTAATLPTAFQPERRGEGGSGATGAGDGAGGPMAPSPFDAPETVIEIPFLTEIGLLLALVAALVVLWRLYTSRRAVFRGVVVVIALAVVAFLISQLFSPDPSNLSSPSFTPWTGNTTSGGASGETVTDPPVLTLVLVLVLTAAVLGTAVAVRQRSPGGSSSSSGDDTASTATAAVARAAGRAADRIEEGDDVDNEVYRAWREMTSLLDIPRPETNTAGEFEAAAVDAGMDPADVHELTALFETVRYGGYDPEPTDERRAIELLRRIENRYSGEES